MRHRQVEVRYKNDTAELKASIFCGSSLLQRALDLLPSHPSSSDEEGEGEEIQTLRSEIVEYLDKVGAYHDGNGVSPLCGDKVGEAEKCRESFSSLSEETAGPSGRGEHLYDLNYIHDWLDGYVAGKTTIVSSNEMESGKEGRETDAVISKASAMRAMVKASPIGF